MAVYGIRIRTDEVKYSWRLQRKRCIGMDQMKCVGRCARTEHGIVLFYTGSGVEFTARGTELWATVEADYGMFELWMDIILDGERIQKLPLRRGTHEYLLCRGLSAEQPARVELLRDTQMIGDDSASYLCVRGLRSDGLLSKTEHKNRRLVFIGDSLTSGEGCGSTRRTEWIPVCFDAVQSYPYLTAKGLDADYQVVSQSGWGLYASFDGNTGHTLPTIYERVCGAASDEKCLSAGAHAPWDFDSFQADAVILNLGTNDSFAMQSGGWSEADFTERFRQKARDFLGTLRRCHPNSRILWIYGMLGHELEPSIRTAVESYKRDAKDPLVSYLSLPECLPTELGAREHPTPEAHQRVAELLIRELGPGQTAKRLAKEA